MPPAPSLILVNASVWLQCFLTSGFLYMPFFSDVLNKKSSKKKGFTHFQQQTLPARRMCPESAFWERMLDLPVFPGQWLGPGFCFHLNWASWDSLLALSTQVAKPLRAYGLGSP